MNNFDKDLICKYIPLEEQEEAFKKLESGYPVQYIIGNVEFFGSIIDVNENVLIPRFETEYLIEHLLFYLRRYNYDNPKILEIGTGSGCISIALAKNLECQIDAIDISKEAIEVAKNNAKKNNTEINFICEDVKDYKTRSKYNVLVSNPPYVARDEEVDPKTKYEPQNAIFAKEKGLYFYNLILDKAPSLLAKENIIAFEIGKDQAESIKEKALSVFPKANVIILKDLNEFDRYIFIINE